MLPDEDLLLHLIQTAIFFVEKQDRAKVRDVRMLAAKMVSAVIQTPAAHSVLSDSQLKAVEPV